MFIVGCARSGTTWTRAILGAHDEVVTGAETHALPVLFDALRSPSRRRGWTAGVLASFDDRARCAAQSFGGTGPQNWIERDALESLLATARGSRLSGDAAAKHVIEGILDAFFDAHRGPLSRVVVEKTPAHVFYAERILDWWPEARVVELLRDGRDVSVSLEHKSRVEAWAPADRAAQATLWVKAVRRGAELKARTEFRGRWHTVRFEDLASDASGTVQRLFEFVGIDASSDVVSRVVESTAFAKANRPGNAHHLRKGVVGDWRNHFSDNDRQLFEALAGDVLREQGYRV